MLKIEVDEAYAFDMLSILELKACNSERDIQNYVQFLRSITGQLGADLTRRIILSEQYAQLLAANQTVFDLIERICAGQALDALVVHEANMGRFHGKRALQAAFFATELAEQKTATSLR